MRSQEVTIHGQPVRFYREGEGPAILLIHGITSSSRAWRPLIPRLAERHEVIAPDLLGHGRSAKPRGDYSLGAYASGLRDLLAYLDVPKATVVGHSLGGGIAMQFAYQYYGRLDRLVLIDSGGLGNEVSLVLRAATLPGAEVVLPLLFSGLTRSAGRLVNRTLAGLGIRAGGDGRAIVEGLDSLADASARRAFVHTARSVIDPLGQRVDARDRLYLSRDVPVLIIWGQKDRIIPSKHGREASELMPRSRFEIIPGAGHFPFAQQPERVAELIEEFVASTEPVEIDEARAAQLLRRESDETG